jgi:hypothetical protein
MHMVTSGYGFARAGVVTSDTVCGDYTFYKRYWPLRYLSRDKTVYVDDDGKSYLLGEVSPTKFRFLN